MSGFQRRTACCGSIVSLLVLLLAQHAYSRDPCDPLVPEYCALPFPNSYFTTVDKSTLTGIRVNFSVDTFPLDIIGRPVDPKEWNEMDGFSPFPSILSYFPELSDHNLPPHWDVKQSLAMDSPTILLEADEGKRIAHFAELDTAIHLAERALMIWPSQRLKDNTRYIVALRKLENKQGELVKPSPAFLALRDNTTTKDPDIEQRRVLYEDIFAQLETVGIKRQSLQLAWDFTTASLDCLTKRLVFARDDAISRVGEKGPSYVIDKIQDNYNENIFRHIEGTMFVPSYITEPLPGSHLVIDGKGLPVYQKDVDVIFTVLIPHSLANMTIDLPLLLQYGHGLFGSQKEVASGYLEAQANQYGYVLFACDWWGMAEYDVPAIAEMLSLNLSDFRIIPDRLTQGMVNAHMLMHLAKSQFSTDPKLNLNGKIKYNSEMAGYYGNSLGGILGEVYMASTTAVTKGVLGVAGGPFGLLLPRSVDFTPFEVGMRVLYPDPVDYSLALALANLLWSRIEPNGYMSSITRNPLPKTPTHRVLYHYALGDAQVNILGLYSVARSAGAVMYQSNVKCQFVERTNETLITENLFGFKLISDDTVVSQDSVVMGFDCGAPPEPIGNTPPEKKTDTHEGPRRSPLAHKQMDQFFRMGEIRYVCDGPCKCKV